MALLAAAGCTGTEGQTGSGDSSGPSTGMPSASASPDLDASLVEQARAELLGITDLARRTGAAHPGLGAIMESLVAMHEAHDLVLAESAPDAVAAPSGEVPERRSLAVSVVRRHEVTLQRQLAEWAGDADSGPLARLFASMSAATAQHLTLLSRVGR